MEFVIKEMRLEGWSGQSVLARYPLGELLMGQYFIVPIAQRDKIRRAVTTFHAYRLKSGVRIKTKTEGDVVKVFRVR